MAEPRFVLQHIQLWGTHFYSMYFMWRDKKDGYIGFGLLSPTEYKLHNSTIKHQAKSPEITFIFNHHFWLISIIFIVWISPADVSTIQSVLYLAGESTASIARQELLMAWIPCHLEEKCTTVTFVFYKIQPNLTQPLVDPLPSVFHGGDLQKSHTGKPIFTVENVCTHSIYNEELYYMSFQWG